MSRYVFFAGLACLLAATVLGFGWVHDSQFADDWGGFAAGGLFLCLLADLKEF